MTTWADDFDGPAGTPPSPAAWTPELGPGSHGELQVYTGARANAALDGAGRLAITARREPDGTITSARLITKGLVELRYGRVEAWMRVPAGRGLWPAFWMLGTDMDAVGWPACGEIDVMEYVGSEPTRVHGTIHAPGYAGIEHGVGRAHDAGAPLAAAFHAYAVDWAPGRITWLLDGRPYSTLTPADVPGGAWPFDHPFHLLVNLAVGGPWPGNDTDDPPLPATLLVDRVCIYGSIAPHGAPAAGPRRRSGGGAGDGVHH